VIGRAVGDVIHLLAELLENAASFSPPATRVMVGGQVLPNGYAIEIEDRGLGMSPEVLAEANRKLTEPPDFDPANSARLGLFVVAQLAHRHGIRISLRSSAFHGITAIVMSPGELVTTAPDPLAQLPSGPAGDRKRGRPLVGTGEDDPSRHSLASLQWQGTEQLESVTVPGREVSVNDIDTTVPIIPQQRTPIGGPAPSAVADGLTAEGLVQRRRTARRPTPEPEVEQPRHEDLAETAAALAQAPPEHPETPAPPGTTSAVLDPSTPDGLPRRVRQASLAPQLRAPVEPEADTVTFRSPEQVRQIMSALQRGTTRGRLAAQGIDPDVSEGGPEGSPLNGTSGYAEAATVIIPVVQNRPGYHGDEYPGAEHEGGRVPDGHGAAGSSERGGAVAGDDRTESHGTRPDKDN
jgi:hypothetical protein